MFPFFSRKVCPDFAGGSVVILPMQETRVQSLGEEGILEKETATHSGVLA